MTSWIKTEYYWWQMTSECNVSQNACIAMVGQAAINAVVLAGDVVIFSLQECSGGFNKAVMAATSSALAINTLFLGLVIYLKARNHCGIADSFLKEANKIRREKCCYDSTIVFSTVYIVMNAAALVAWRYFCK